MLSMLHSHATANWLMHSTQADSSATGFSLALSQRRFLIRADGFAVSLSETNIVVFLLATSLLPSTSLDDFISFAFNFLNKMFLINKCHYAFTLNNSVLSLLFCSHNNWNWNCLLQITWCNCLVQISLHRAQKYFSYCTTWYALVLTWFHPSFFN